MRLCTKQLKHSANTLILFALIYVIDDKIPKIFNGVGDHSSLLLNIMYNAKKCFRQGLFKFNIIKCYVLFPSLQIRYNLLKSSKFFPVSIFLIGRRSR